MLVASFFAACCSGEILSEEISIVKFLCRFYKTIIIISGYIYYHFWNLAFQYLSGVNIYLHLTPRWCDLCSEAGRREREEADVWGFPGAESVSRDLPDTRGHQDIRSYQDPVTDQSRHFSVTYSESQSGGNNPGKVLNCNPGHFWRSSDILQNARD